jgi:type IV pilus assembly protein PilF
MRFSVSRAVFLFICVPWLFAGCAAGNGQLQKERAMAREQLAFSFIQQGRFNEGIEHLQEAVKLDPKNVNLYHALALAYKELGAFPKARVYFDKTLKLKPDFSEAWNNLGTLYLTLREWDQAVSCFNNAVANLEYRTPHFAYNNLGLALYYKGEYRKAIESYEKALKSMPSYGVCYGNLGLAQEASGNRAAAIEAYEKAIRYDPGYPAAHFYLGRLYLNLDRGTEGARELKLAIDVDKEGTFAKEARILLDQMGKK